MPTLFERIQGQADASPILGLVADVESQLSQARTLFETLPSAPDEALSGMLSALGDLPIPQIQVAATIGGRITSLAGNMPDDLGDITGIFDSVLGSLAGSIEVDFVPMLQSILSVISAVDALGNFSFSASVSSERELAAPAGAGAEPGSGGTRDGPVPGGGVGGSRAPADPEVAAARERRVAAAAGAAAGLNLLPTPLTAPTLVQFAAQQLDAMPRDVVQVRRLPFFDEFHHLMQTVVAMQAMDEAALTAHNLASLEGLAQFLHGSFPGYLDAYQAEVDAFRADALLPDLTADLSALKTALTTVTTALTAGDLTPASAELTELDARLTGLAPRLAWLRSAPAAAEVRRLELRTRHLPLELERQMVQMIRVVDPANTAARVAELRAPLERWMAAVPLEQFGADLEEILNQPLRLFDALDAAGVTEALQAPTQAVNDAVTEIESLMTQAATQVSELFHEARTLLDQADPQELLDEMEAAMDEFRLELENAAGELFAPITDAIETALSTLDDAANDFDPSVIIDALSGFLEDVAGIFDEGPVKEALDTLQQGIQSVTASVQAIHFSPVTDLVNDEIEGITAALNAVDPDTLSTEARLALTAAAALLPGDLDPVTDPLVDGFETLVDTVPKPLVQVVLEKVTELRTQVEQFSPAALVGDTLSKPFNDLIDLLDAFDPANLLAPVRTALEGSIAELKDLIDPAAALAPLQNAYDDLLKMVDQLNPAQLVAPVEAALQSAIQTVTDLLPVDEILDVFGSLLDRIQHVLDLVQPLEDGLGVLVDLLNALDDSEQQLRDWLAPVLARVAKITDVAPYQTAATQARDALAASRAADLTTRLDAAWQDLGSELDALDPTHTLEELVELRRLLRADRITNLPDNADKALLESLLPRFEPLGADFAEPLRSLAEWREGLAAARTARAQQAGMWDARHHRAGGPLADLVPDPLTPEALRAAISDALEEEVIVPLGALLQLVHEIGGVARVPLEELLRFITEFRSRAEALLTGPDSLGGLHDGLAEMVALIENVDLEFLTRELDGIFQDVKSKFDILNPEHVAEQVSLTIDTALNAIGIDALLPAGAEESLSATYQQIIDKLRELDPANIVQQAVQPVYDEQVLPSVEKIDITPLLVALLAKLDELKGELETELDTLNRSYGEMIDAIPTIDPSELIGDAVGAIGDAVGGSLGF